MHATFNKHKVPNVLSKIKLMLPTSVISSLLGEVGPKLVLGEKRPTFLNSFPKEPFMRSCVVQAWNVTKVDIYGSLTMQQALLCLIFLFILPHLILTVNLRAREYCDSHPTFLNRNCLENGKVRYSKYRQLESGFLPET